MRASVLYACLKKLSDAPVYQHARLVEELDFSYSIEGRVMPSDVVALLVEIKAGLPAFKFNPNHDPSNGQFTFGSGEDSNGNSDTPDAIKPVYPVESALTFLLGGQAVIASREALGLVEGLGSIEDSVAETNLSGLTSHGAERLVEREITNQEVQEALQSAKASGNVLTQMGKYGTPQQVYKGSNGVIVVIETIGRNAGKVITSYRSGR